MELPDCVAGQIAWEEFKAEIDATRPPEKVEPFSTVCEICESVPANVYCDQDKAHLCFSCDESHHASSKLLMHHVRVPLYHSPFQFGFCQVHAGDRYECVCLDCGVLLCSLCLLVGDHSQLSDHRIVSTMEAFRLSLTETLRESEMKARMMTEMGKMHALVVQAESNHWNIQQGLDTELRSVLNVLVEMKLKRIHYIQSVRRQSLLIVTLLEWFESFLVHARLSLPPSGWLQFFHRARRECMHNLIGVDREISPVESIAQYVKTCLPTWTTGRVGIEGFVQVDRTIDAGIIELPSRMPATTILPFEWIPEPSRDESLPVSPESLRKNRMATRVAEYLAPNNVEKENFIIPFETVPLDNVKDFVLQTLAVLAESESQLVLPKTVKGDSAKIDLAKMDLAKTNLADLPSHSFEKVQAMVPSSGLPTSSGENQLQVILSSGPTPFANAVAILSAAPNGEKPELIRMFVALFRESTEPMSIKSLIEAICLCAVSSIEASNFLISSVSMLVPTTAAFLLFLFPNDARFLDQGLRETLNTVLDETPTESIAESGIRQYIGGIPSIFPQSITFLFSTVFNAALKRFPQNIAIGVTTGLFLARIVSPRLLWSAPKSSGDTQAPPVVTLMTRYLHRMAGAAAEGHSALSGRAHKDPETIALHACISQVNSMLMKNVINKGDAECPKPDDAMTPRAAATKIDIKMKEYGKGISSFTN